MNPKDIVGKKFNMLTVKKYHGVRILPSKQRNHVYVCECECGKITKVIRNKLTSLRTKSCGCLTFNHKRADPNDIIDKTFGKLTVKKHDGFYARLGCKQKNHFYICECKCGKIKKVSRRALIGSETRSCGCLLKAKGKDNKGWKGFKEISGRYWNDIKNGAKKGKRNLDFDITIEYIRDLWKSQNGRCVLTGLPINLPKGKQDKYRHTASLDRIDSTKGYIKENVQWTHKDVNRIKSDFPQDRFIELCLLVAKKMI